MGIVLALGAAVFLSWAPVLQQGVAAGAPERLAMSPRLLGWLARHPVWLLGVGAIVVGSALQTLALHLLGLTLAEPLLSTNIVLALGFTALRDRHRPRRQDWLGAALVFAALAAGLVLLRPGAGAANPPGRVWAVALGAVAGFVLGAVVLARRARGVVRSALLGAATGAGLGMQDPMNRAASSLVAEHGLAGLAHWQPWGVVAAGLVAFVIQQLAHRAAAVPASQPALLISQFVVAVSFGIFILEEPLRGSGWAMAGGVVCLAVAAWGVALLLHSPLATREATLAARARRHAGL